MRKSDAHDEIEKALMRLMPAAFSESTQVELEKRLDELSGDSDVIRHDFSRWAKWLVGIAVALAIGVFAFYSDRRDASPVAGLAEEERLLVLNELDRVENVRDEGLFVDAGGSAVRKMSIRVIGESKILDEETGIEVSLTEPRQEMYLLPVSTF